MLSGGDCFSGMPVLRQVKGTATVLRHDLFNVSGLLSQIMLVQSLPHEDFDYCLPADIEFSCRNIQFVEHILGEINIHSLYGRHHATSIGEIA